MHGTKKFSLIVGLGMLAGAAAAQPAPPSAGIPGGQFGGPPAFIPQPMMGPTTPDLAKKMAAIAALRQIHELRMSAREIGAVLPMLKDMREAEKSLEAQAGEALEQEKRALLAAAPDTQVPPASGDKLRAANERFRQTQERAWRALFQQVGERIGSGIQRILQGGMGMGPGGGIAGPPPGFTPGQAFTPGPGFPGEGPGRPGNLPPGGAPRPGTPPRLGQGEVGPPPGAPGAAPQPPGAPDQFPQPPQPRIGQGGARGTGQRPQPGAQFGQPGQDPRVRPGGGAGFAGPPMGMGPGWQPMGAMPRVSLAEFIDLLEQKQAAMRK